MIGHPFTALSLAVLLVLAPAQGPGQAEETGDPEAGREVFRACVSCHSTVAGRHMTGPSLADIWGRKAGTIEAFGRYSEALKQSGVTWDAESLDAWLRDPRGFIPGNRMTFPGLPDAAARQDLIAYLHQLSKAGGTAAAPPASGGMAGQGELLDLKALDPNNRVTAIRLCGDTYSVTAASGEVYQFWEFNLRFKTDGSDKGPAPGQPVIIPGGMRGDRAYVIFASPAEISPFVAVECP